MLKDRADDGEVAPKGRYNWLRNTEDFAEPGMFENGGGYAGDAAMAMPAVDWGINKLLSKYVTKNPQEMAQEYAATHALAP